MKPPRFDYLAPTDLETAVERLGELGGDCKVLAGGQSLIPLLNFRLAAPDCLIDVNGIVELSGMRETSEQVVLGATTRHRSLERDPRIGDRLPLLPLAARHIGHPQIRTRGTLGGSLAHADPSAELPTAMVALDAVVIAASRRGERRIPAGEFFTFHLSTVLEPDELITGVEIPLRPERQGCAFLEVAARQGDFAAAGAAVVLHLDGKSVVDARIVCSSVGATPVRVPEAEAAIRGRSVDPEALREVEAAVRRCLDPAPQLKISAEYKRRTAAVLARRAVAAASGELEELAA